MTSPFQGRFRRWLGRRLGVDSGIALAYEDGLTDAWKGREFVSGDDSVTCGLCGKETSLAMIVHHLVTEHEVDPDEITRAEIRDEDA